MLRSLIFVCGLLQPRIKGHLFLPAHTIPSDKVQQVLLSSRYHTRTQIANTCLPSLRVTDHSKTATAGPCPGGAPSPRQHRDASPASRTQSRPTRASKWQTAPSGKPTKWRARERQIGTSRTSSPSTCSAGNGPRARPTVGRLAFCFVEGGLCTVFLGEGGGWTCVVLVSDFERTWFALQGASGCQLWQHEGELVELKGRECEYTITWGSVHPLFGCC